MEACHGRVDGRLTPVEAGAKEISLSVVPTGLRLSGWVVPALKNLCKKLCRPYGAGVNFPLYPGLTPWANTNSAPAGLIFSHSIHRGERNQVLTHNLKASATRHRYGFLLITLAGFLFLAFPAVAQIQVGDKLNMNMNGIVSVGYNDIWGNTIDSSHSLNVGGNGTLSGFYHDPNFLVLNLSPYYNQSSQNSTSRSLFNSSGFEFSSNIFGGSHFPGFDRLFQVLGQPGKLRASGHSGLHHPWQWPRLQHWLGSVPAEVCRA